jgi:hypothetical protein
MRYLMASSDIAAVLAAAAGALSSAVLGFFAIGQRHAREVADSLKEREGARATSPEAIDIRQLHERLFTNIGQLSLQQYVADDVARAVVARSIDRAQLLVDAPSTHTASRTTTSHIDEARSALERGDIVSALARARLALELALRDLMTIYGLEGYRKTGGALIRQLVQAGLLAPALASYAQEAFSVASRGLHGEPVDPVQARWAIQAIDELLDSLTPQAPEP